MTEKQWNIVKASATEGVLPGPQVGFIVDSPWLPHWAGVSILDYLASEEIWLRCNVKAIEQFPSVIFLPGFWAEFGMCTEPSAFGSVPRLQEDEFPHPGKTISEPEKMASVDKPDPTREGLLPLVIKRMQLAEPEIARAGHRYCFAVSRGPMNIASYLMGTTEFLTALKIEPEKTHALLKVVTGFIGEWLSYQRECFPTIEGVMILDDIVGFLGPDDFLEFAHPYMKTLFSAQDVPVKFFHNDAPCGVSAPYYAEWGVNLYNPGVQSTVSEIMEMTEGKITILGTLPPRDVMADGSPEEVQSATEELVDRYKDNGRLILSTAGGMPPGVPTENIEAMVRTVEAHTPSS